MSTAHNTSFLGTFSMPRSDPETPTMVKVDHVSMIFNVASEQLNSLKEYAIAFARRELMFKEFKALDDVSFEVKKGDVFGILGTNGSGKSTMLKIIAGVLEPSKGTCSVNGSIAPLIELGAGFDLELTARENIYLNGALLGYSKQFINQHFEEIVEFAEVRDFLDMPMKNYSSGMVARIAFAIATVIVPEILIVDEVLSVGDFMFQQKCERRIQALIKQHGVTVLIVSHSNEQIERLCNKAVWIEKGHLRAIGDASEVCQLYRAIGGRTGSPESEKIILDLLNMDLDLPEDMAERVYGENRYGVPVQMNEFTQASGDAVVITNNDFECENRIATSLAGALGAAVLTSGPDKLPEVTLQEIRHYSPDVIITVGSSKQLRRGMLDSVAFQGGHQPKVESIEMSDCPSGIEAYEFALSSGATWGSTAILAAPEPSSNATLFSPFAYACKAPFLFFEKNGAVPGELENVLSNFETVIVLNGPTISIEESALERLQQDKAVSVFSDAEPYKAMETVSNWLTENHFKQSDTLVITAANNEIDNHLIGSFAGRMDALLVLDDTQSLDNIANTLKFVNFHADQKSKLVFLGSEMRFSNLDKSLFCKAATLPPGSL